MSRGVETTLVRPEPSWAVSNPKSWRLWPTSQPAVSVDVEPSKAPNTVRLTEAALPGTVAGLVAPSCCSQACMPKVNWPVKVTSRIWASMSTWRGGISS